MLLFLLAVCFDKCCEMSLIVCDFVDGLHPRQDSMDVSCAMEVECRCNEILKPLERRRQRERHRCLAHSLVGTPNYIAPEVLLREGKLKFYFTYQRVDCLHLNIIKKF